MVDDSETRGEEETKGEEESKADDEDEMKEDEMKEEPGETSAFLEPKDINVSIHEIGQYSSDRLVLAFVYPIYLHNPEIS